MNYKTHTAGGLLVGVATAVPMSNYLEISTLLPTMLGVGFVISSIVGSLFVDLDHKGSYFGRRFRITSTIFSSIFGHRGATHSPLFMLGFTIVLYMLSRFFYVGMPSVYFSVAFYLGAMSHIALDWLTVGGVPLLYPLRNKKAKDPKQRKKPKKYSLLKVSSGGFTEKLMFLLCMGASIYLISKQLL